MSYACNRKHDIWMEVLLGAMAWQQMFANAASVRKLHAVSAWEEVMTFFSRLRGSNHIIIRALGDFNWIRRKGIATSNGRAISCALPPRARNLIPSKFDVIPMYRIYRKNIVYEEFVLQKHPHKLNAVHAHPNRKVEGPKRGQIVAADGNIKAHCSLCSLCAINLLIRIH